MKKSSGFSIIEVLIAVGILAAVGLSITYFITSQKEATVKISTTTECQTLTNNLTSAISNYGDRLSFFDPVINQSENDMTRPGEFVTNWTPLPILKDLGNQTPKYEVNTFQLVKNSINVLLATYNEYGAANVCDSPLDITSRLQGLIGRSVDGATVTMTISPVDLVTGNSLGCLTNPLRIGPIHPNPTFPESGDFQFFPTNIGMKAIFDVTFGDTNQCSSEVTTRFSADQSNIISLANVNVTTGAFDSNQPHTSIPGEINAGTLQFDTDGDGTDNTEYYTCDAQPNYQNITVRIPLDSKGIELGSALICRGHTEADATATPPVAAQSGDWEICDNVNFPSSPNTQIDTYYSSSNNIITIHIAGLEPEYTHRLEIGSFDSGGNFASTSFTVSIDGARPNIVNLGESDRDNSAGFIISAYNPPRTYSDPLYGNFSANSWSRPDVQCVNSIAGNSQVTFQGDIQGSLLSRTLSCTNGPAVLSGGVYHCNLQTTPTLNRLNTVTMRARDLCDLGPQANYSWPVLIGNSISSSATAHVMTQPYGAFVNLTHLFPNPIYQNELTQVRCDCTPPNGPISGNRFCAVGSCPRAGGTPAPEYIRYSTVDICGRSSVGNTFQYCPSSTYWGYQRCLDNRPNPQDEHACIERTDRPGCFEPSLCTPGFGTEGECLAASNPFCTDSNLNSCEVGSNGCYQCACDGVAPNAYDQLAQCMSSRPNPLNKWTCIDFTQSGFTFTCEQHYQCPNLSWSSNNECKANAPCSTDCAGDANGCYSCPCQESLGQYSNLSDCNATVQNNTQYCVQRTMPPSSIQCYVRESCPTLPIYTDHPRSNVNLYLTNPSTPVSGYTSCQSSSCVTNSEGLCYYEDFNCFPKTNNGLPAWKKAVYSSRATCESNIPGDPSDPASIRSNNTCQRSNYFYDILPIGPSGPNIPVANSCWYAVGCWEGFYTPSNCATVCGGAANCTIQQPTSPSCFTCGTTTTASCGVAPGQPIGAMFDLCLSDIPAYCNSLESGCCSGSATGVSDLLEFPSDACSGGPLHSGGCICD